MYGALSWAGTVVFAIAFAVTLLVFDVALRVSSLFGLRAVERMGIVLQVALVRCLPLVGTRVEIERSPRVAENTSYLIISNHQSMFDIPLFGFAFRSHAPKFISKQSLGRGLPAISTHLRLAKHPLIDRSDRSSSVEAIRELGARVAAGRASAVLFPEGTRSRAGRPGTSYTISDGNHTPHALALQPAASRIQADSTGAQAYLDSSAQGRGEGVGNIHVHAGEASGTRDH